MIVVSHDDYLAHYGIKRRSGRFRYGTGEIPYQHEPWFTWSNGGAKIDDDIDIVRKYRSSGLSQKEFCDQWNGPLDKKSKDRLSTKKLRSLITIVRNYDQENLRTKIRELQDLGMSNTKIADALALDLKEAGKSSNESTIRSIMNSQTSKRTEILQGASDALKKAVGDGNFVDVGAGTDISLGITKTMLDTAIESLLADGYEVFNYSQPQAGTNNSTTIKVLAPPGSSARDFYERVKVDPSFIKPFDFQSAGDVQTTESRLGIKPPVSISADRVMVRYPEDGGAPLDGTIEIRRGVKDLSLGNNMYAQVRIAVNGTHYLKGMAVYHDDITDGPMPPGVDIIFNTSKPSSYPPMNPDDKDHQVFKTLKSDSENVFGSSLKPEEKLTLGQFYYEDDDGQVKQSAINFVSEQGDWDGWGRTLSSQFLSRQPDKLVKQQLNLAYTNRKVELDEIMRLENGEIKRMLLEDFAKSCDSDAKHLKAAALPRQANKVVLPLPHLKDDEVFAPAYENGDVIICIRHPHAGPFEIVKARVNNNDQKGINQIGIHSVDAIGLNANNLKKMSGADTDGDTVTTIPIRTRDGKININVNVDDVIEELRDFDPRTEFPAYPGMKRLTNKRKQNLMGTTTNLLMDMSTLGVQPSTDEFIRAVKHSMVVIDAEKHNLDYKGSENKFGIKQLREKYQLQVDPVTGKLHTGAATLMTRAKSERHVPELAKYPDVDPETGKLIRKPTGAMKGKFAKVKGFESDTEPTDTPEKGSFYKKDSVTRTVKDPVTGEKTKVTKNVWHKYTKVGEVVKTKKYEAMDIVDDAYELLSRDPVTGEITAGPKEMAYADYANNMKQLANIARKEALRTPSLRQNSEAKIKYAAEIAELDRKLKIAESNAPKEREAQRYAYATVEDEKSRSNDLSYDDIKKLKGHAITTARSRVGANKKKVAIQITDREWEAIQSGAISSSKLKRIINNTDKDRIKQLATPRTNKGLSSSQIDNIVAWRNSGYPLSEIAKKFGVSTSTISKVLNGTYMR